MWMAAALTLAGQDRPALRVPRWEAVTISPQRLLVSNSGSGASGSIAGDSVTAIDTATNQVITTLRLNAGDSPLDVAVLPDNSRAYAANTGCSNCADRGVTVFDPAAMTSSGLLTPGRFPAVLAVSLDGTRLYVGDSNALRVFDVAGGNQVIAVDLQLPIQSLALSADGLTIYAVVSSSTYLADAIWVVSAANPLSATFYRFPDGSGCSSVALMPGSPRLYVSCAYTGALYAITINADGTLSLANTFSTSLGTFALAFSPDGKKLYAPHADSGAVEVLDPTNGARLSLVTVQSTPVNVVVNKAGTRAYVANYGGNSVSVLDATTDTVIATVPVGPNPIGLALTAGAVPAVPAGGVANGASFAPNAPVAAGSLVSIFGTNLGPATPASAPSLPLPTTLSGVRVTVGGRAAPLIYVSSGQINCQLPFELAGQTSVPVVVESDGVSSSPVMLSLAASAPGIFTLTVSGRTQGAVLNENDSLNTTSNPARSGEVIQVFATGQGAVTNAPATGAGAPASPLATTPATPVVLVGGVQALVLFSGLTPGYVGLWQVNARVPSGVTPGDSVTLQIVHNGAISNTAMISVR